MGVNLCILVMFFVLIIIIVFLYICAECTIMSSLLYVRFVHILVCEIFSSCSYVVGEKYSWCEIL